MMMSECLRKAHLDMYISEIIIIIMNLLI